MHAAELAHDAKAIATARANAKAAARNSDAGDGGPSVPRAPADRDPDDEEADTAEADDVLAPLGGIPPPAPLTINMTVHVFPHHSKWVFGSLHLRRLGLAVMTPLPAAVGCSSPLAPSTTPPAVCTPCDMATAACRTWVVSSGPAPLQCARKGLGRQRSSSTPAQTSPLPAQARKTCSGRASSVVATPRPAAPTRSSASGRPTSALSSQPRPNSFARS